MNTRPSPLLACVLLLAPLTTLAAQPAASSPSTVAPLAAPKGDAGVARFDTQGQLLPPTDYRQWVYLSSGFDMSYNPALRMGHHMFDNVFVDPASYRSFLLTGTWPDRTMLVMETRGAEQQGSINKAGHYQAGSVMGLEVHVRDDARFPGRWAFFGFDGSAPAAAIPRSASCYRCHGDHGAVDTTFVQFYPTLLPVAEGKGTLSPTYLQMRAQLAAPRQR